MPRAYRSWGLRPTCGELHPRLSWKSGLRQLLLEFAVDFWQESKEAWQAELVGAQSEHVAAGRTRSPPHGCGSSRQFVRRSPCPAGQRGQGLSASAQAPPQPRATSHSHDSKGMVSPRAPSHTTPPGCSPDSASFLGSSLLACLGLLLGESIPLLGQEHRVEHSRCKGEVREEASSGSGSLRAREQRPQPPGSSQLGHYLCGHSHPQTTTLSWASQKWQGLLLGVGSLLQAWKREGTGWARGLHARVGAGAEWSCWQASLGATGPVLEGTQLCVGPEGPHGLYQPVPVLRSPSCQEADGRGTRPPCCPHSPSRLSPSHKARRERTGRFVCALQGKGEAAAAGRAGSRRGKEPRFGRRRALTRGCPHSRGWAAAPLNQPGAAEALLLTLAAWGPHPDWGD